MRLLFPAARLALLLALAWCLDPLYGIVSGALLILASISFVVFEVLSDWVAHRRLCFRLGVIHQIWANADRFQTLQWLRWTTFPRWALADWWKPSSAYSLMYGFFGSLRGWWVLQCIYEVCLASLVVAAVVYVFLSDYFIWSSLPCAMIAVIILASRRAMSIYDPEKFYPKF